LKLLEFQGFFLVFRRKSDRLPFLKKTENAGGLILWQKSR